MIDLRQTRRRRGVSLTPMIDVVFLLLVFFMLASRFGVEHEQPLAAAGAGAYSGPPRLVQVTPTGLRLNGRQIAADALPAALRPLMTSADDVVVVQPEDGANIQRLVTIVSALRAAGIGHIALVK